MQALIWFSGGILVGAGGMFSVMLYLMMTKEWQQLQRETRKEKG